MFHHVYANDRSICCKAGTGTSTAMADVCWTPPQNCPVPIPYVNKVEAGDLTEGSKTVSIQSSEIAKRDESYIATSMGNTSATKGCGQGLLTGVIEGKAYFTSWSMDVKVEGQNVCRHNDLMTHNHGSKPGNTAPFPFVEKAKMTKGHPCSKAKKKIEKECAQDDPKDDKGKGKKTLRPKKKSRTLDRFKKSLKKKDNNKGGKHIPWTDDHCFGLNLKPRSAEDLNAIVDDAKEALDTLTDPNALLGGLKEFALDLAKDKALKLGGKLALKAGLKQAAGSTLPLIGQCHHVRVVLLRRRDLDR